MIPFITADYTDALALFQVNYRLARRRTTCFDQTSDELPRLGPSIRWNFRSIVGCKVRRSGPTSDEPCAQVRLDPHFREAIPKRPVFFRILRERVVIFRCKPVGTFEGGLIPFWVIDWDIEEPEIQYAQVSL